MAQKQTGSRDRVRLVFPEPFYPYAFIREGKPTGLALELLAAILPKEGIEPDFAGLDLDQVEAELNSGAARGAAVSGVIPERRERMDFSDPLCRSEAGLFGLKSEPARFGLEDCAGLTIATPARGPLVRFIRAGEPKAKVLLVEDYAASLEAVLAGRAQAAALNRPVAREMVEEGYPVLFRVPDRPILAIDLALAVLKGTNQDLIRAVNRGLQRASADGTRDRLIKEWRL